MNGTESLLLIIVGILAVKFSFHLENDISGPGQVNIWDLDASERNKLLLIRAYAWTAFIGGNFMFFQWFYKTYYPM